MASVGTTTGVMLLCPPVEVVSEQVALATVSDKYASLEELIYTIGQNGLLEAVTTGEYNLEKLSEVTDIRIDVLDRVMQSQSFRNVMSRSIAMRAFSFVDEIQHMEKVKKKAIDTKSSIDTLIKAGEYLRRVQERPVTGSQQQVMVPIQINIEQVAESDGGHQSAKAGDLPPENIRSKVVTIDETNRTASGVRAGSGLDFDSDAAPYDDVSPFEESE